jgi:hypothetical protein
MAAAVVAGLFLGEAGLVQTVDDKPLVELGIAGIGGTFSDYPASAQNHFHALPLPYIIYRGEYLQLAPNSRVWPGLSPLGNSRRVRCLALKSSTGSPDVLVPRRWI